MDIGAFRCKIMIDVPSGGIDVLLRNVKRWIQLKDMLLLLIMGEVSTHVYRGRT
jgi:hypothetical protein